MSLTEILVVAFGFFLGYWVIAKLFGAKAPAPRDGAAQERPRQDRGPDA